MFYLAICFFLVLAGSALLFLTDKDTNPGTMIVAIALIAVGLFLLLFRRKGAQDVTDAAEAVNRNSHLFD